MHFKSRAVLSDFGFLGNSGKRIVFIDTEHRLCGSDVTVTGVIKVVIIY